MLTNSRQDDEKTVMGIFSLLPDLKEIQHLKAEMNEYQSDNRYLYVWHEDPQSQVQGVVGIEIINPELVLVRQLILMPDVRSDANYRAVLTDLQALYPNSFIMGSIATQKLIRMWRTAQS